MKHRGADIRILEIPKDQAVNAVKEFVRVNQLEIDEINTDKNETTIKALHHIGSNIRFLWKGLPQVIEYNISEYGESTKIETRFGLQSKFRYWYWGTLTSLMVFFFFVLELADYFGQNLHSTLFASEISRRYIIYTLCNSFAILSILTCLILSGIAIHTALRYKQFILSFYDKLPYPTKQFQSNYTFPDIIEILLLFLFIFPIFIFRHGASQILDSDFLLLMLFLVALIFFLAGVVFFGLRTKGFMERVTFILIGVQIVLPLLMFYCIPYVNLVTENIGESYAKLLDTENIIREIEPTEAMLDNFEALNDIVRLQILGKPIAYFIFISIGFLFLLSSSKVAKEVINTRITTFQKTHKESNYRKALDFSDFSKSFPFIVVGIWLFSSIILYLEIYAVLSILEYNVFEQNLVFDKVIGKRFFEEAHVVLQYLFIKYIPAGLITFIQRVIILIYLFPILWILFQFGKKRMTNYLTDI